MRVLIADDDRMGRRILESLLRRSGYEVLQACDGLEAWRVLQREDSPKLVLLDWMMPGLSGIEICRRLRGRSPYVYVILLTNKSTKQDVLQGMDAGADDYLVKPFDAEELEAHLRAGRRVIELQEQLISAREALQFRASHDPLTGLWNRAGILDILRAEFSRSRRNNVPLGLILVDLDHFKRINDTYGHLVGDAVLAATAEKMRSSVRVYDAIGRYGGEEFLVIVPGADVASTSAQAERLRASLAEQQVSIPGGQLGVTISLGVAAGIPSEKDSEDSMLHMADCAVYRAKSMGRNRVQSVGVSLGSADLEGAAAERIQAGKRCASVEATPLICDLRRNLDKQPAGLL